MHIFLVYSKTGGYQQKCFLPCHDCIGNHFHGSFLKMEYQNTIYQKSWYVNIFGNQRDLTYEVCLHWIITDIVSVMPLTSTDNWYFRKSQSNSKPICHPWTENMHCSFLLGIRGRHLFLSVANWKNRLPSFDLLRKVIQGRSSFTWLSMFDGP